MFQRIPAPLFLHLCVKNLPFTHTQYMPAAYTHHLLAASVLSALDEPFQQKLRPYLPLYFFGAQGADFCFFYPVVDGKNTANFGRYLHRKGGYAAFAVCKAFSSSENALFAYSLGYITHYAADVTFHPYVYATAGKSPLRHTRIERALDQYLQSIYKSQNDFPEHFGQKLSKSQSDELFLLYAAIAANAGFPPLKKAAFLRSIFVFNAYMPRIPTLFSVKNPMCIQNLANAENRPWRYPEAPEKHSDDGGKELFEKSLQLSLQLIEQFTKAVRNRTPLSIKAFGKNYLSGL